MREKQENYQDAGLGPAIRSCLSQLSLDLIYIYPYSLNAFKIFVY